MSNSTSLSSFMLLVSNTSSVNLPPNRHPVSSQVWPISILAVMYISILVMGCWASRRPRFSTTKRRKRRDNATEIDSGVPLKVAGDENDDKTSIIQIQFSEKDEGENQIRDALTGYRSFDTFVSSASMAATAICGGFINGTAESVFRDGILWTLAWPGIALGLSIGGILFAAPMRSKGFSTMLDPFNQRVGSVATIPLLAVPLLADTLWSASVLAALADTVSIITDGALSKWVIIPSSGIIAAAYTLYGHLVAVAYTDILQLLYICVGLSVSSIFCLVSYQDGSYSIHGVNYTETSSNTTMMKTPDFLGPSPFSSPASMVQWSDLAVALTLGSIPWQAYFQRVCACTTPAVARKFSMIAGFSAFIVGIPAVLIGCIAQTIDWSTVLPTLLNSSVSSAPNPSQILPLTIRAITPYPVQLACLSALAAGVMSSCDSCFIGSASLVTLHVFQPLMSRYASNTEKPKDNEYSSRQVSSFWCFRVCVLLFGIISCWVALQVTSVYAFFIFAADLVYCVMFPQLLCVVYSKWFSRAGCLTGFVVTILLRTCLVFHDFFPVFASKYFFTEFIVTTLPWRSIIASLGVLIIVVISFIQSKKQHNHTIES